tara:strand:+ start:75 stop:320 length:246 start_codon:yes stop_codon:yes gene_type:complete
MGGEKIIQMKKAILKEPRILLLAIAAVMFVITSLSSCASSYHTTADGFNYKKAGKGYHWESHNGKVTKKKGTPSCVKNWSN